MDPLDWATCPYCTRARLLTRFQVLGERRASGGSGILLNLCHTGAVVAIATPRLPPVGSMLALQALSAPLEAARFEGRVVRRSGELFVIAFQTPPGELLEHVSDVGRFDGLQRRSERRNPPSRRPRWTRPRR